MKTEMAYTLGDVMNGGEKTLKTIGRCSRRHEAAHSGMWQPAWHEVEQQFCR